MKLSQRINQIKPSAAVDLDRKLALMREAGKQIISLSAGQPDFATPENIVRACNAALADGKTKYTSINGIAELRKAICGKLKKDNNITYTPEEIVVTTGAKQALFNAIQALVNPGDEVIIPTPCWISYKEMVKLAMGEPVPVPTTESFHPDFAAISKAITERTKAIIINTPNNPTGAVFTQAELEKLASLALEHNFYIISDEVYEKLIYGDGRHFSIASISEEVKNICVTINGFSKAYSMTGWRLGYAACPENLALAICSIQGHTTSNSTTFVQYAGIEALKGPQDSVETMRKEFENRLLYVYNRLTSIKGVTCVKPQGAFYLFPDISYYLGSAVKDETELCSQILDKAGVAVLPGCAFDGPGHVRISCSNSMDNLCKGIDSIEKVLAEL